MVKQLPFKEIPNYNGYYINENGDIMSTKRNNPKILKANLGRRGYLVVGLCIDGKEKKYKVHQLVAMAFLGHTPCGYELVVDHIDNDKLNNNVNNLQLISQKQNARKNTRKGTSKYLGVSWVTREKKWNARITINNKYKSLGNYIYQYHAHLAVQNALINE